MIAMKFAEVYDRKTGTKHISSGNNAFKSIEKNICNYSYLNASIGSSKDALRAG